MNNKTDIDVQYVSPLKRICMTIGELPSSYLETMSYYEMLIWFTEFLKNKVIPTINNNAEAVQELQTLYEELRTYVNDYFDNLDVQDEINNKLEAMAESGQLTDIIAQYLGLAGMIAFDTVSDMKQAENLVNGSKCATFGYHSVNDGGKAFYKVRTVTNEDTIDEGFIIALHDNTLVAELIIDNNELKLKQLGLQSTNEDISSTLQSAINKSYDNFSILVDDFYNLTETITINRPVIIKGKIGNYDNWGNSGFLCTGDKTFFILDEGCVNSTFEQIIFKGSKTYSQGYEGTCIRFSSRDVSQTGYRVWKNLFSKCHFTHFAYALNFYATGNIANWDFSSEILFLHCKFLNNTVNGYFKNKQSYNINFIASDLESWYGSTGFICNTLSGINLYGCSILLRGDLIQAQRDDTLTPASAFGGTLNVTACRFEIITATETVFNFNMTGGTYPGVSGDNHANLNVSDCEFLIHDSGNNATLLHTNLQGFQCNMKGLTFTGDDSRKLKLNIDGKAAITEYSRIIIETSDYKRLVLENNTTGNAYKPWVIVNGVIWLSCASGTYGNNYFEINDRLYLGYNKSSKPNEFSVFVPWQYKKFVINVSGAFMANTGNIVITNSDNTFTETYTLSTHNLEDMHTEILLPYKENGDTYTITSTNIWGNCYFEK